jgi:CHAT domain-containing protein
LRSINSGSRERIQTALSQVWSSLKDKLIDPLAQALTGRGFREITLVPCGTLGLLPLPALLSDHLAVSLIPSARAWKSALDAASERAPREPRLLAVDNPDGSLPFSALEVDAITPLFSPTLQRRLTGKAATRSEVIAAAPAVTHFHFVCHGAYEAVRPLESTLTLAGSEPLKVRDLLDGTLDLSASKLVVLSACETGIFDVRTAPDEILGFPASFLQAGAPAVISTLWRVSDVSTALLLGRLYTLYLKEGLSIAEALRQARLWLRNATAAEMGLADLYQEIHRRTRKNAFAAAQEKYRRRPEEKPFADPYYWAPFVLHGTAAA